MQPQVLWILTTMSSIVMKPETGSYPAPYRPLQAPFVHIQYKYL